MSKTKDNTRELSSIRDTVESVWVAIILAFVLRAFLIQAFVIPTGSMAPRLMGQHWQLECPSCHYRYAYGFRGRGRGVGAAGAECPNCGMPYVGQQRNVDSGDRVLVMKYLYHLRPPKPWDVVVFRNPQNNRENYIKRLVGLPGETIEIVRGDVFVADQPDGPFHVRRKPYAAQAAMWQPVFMNDYRPNYDMLRDADVRQPLRQWVPSRGGDAWQQQGDGGRTFRYTGTGKPAVLAFQAGREAFMPYYGYNYRNEEQRHVYSKADVCTDLKLAATFLPEQGDSKVGLSMTSLDNVFFAEVHADGQAMLTYRNGDGTAHRWKAKVDPLALGRGHAVALTHADFRATLWIDDEPVVQTTDEVYSGNYQAIKRRVRMAEDKPIPTPEVQLVASGGPLELRHVKLMRDVYYTQQTIPEQLAALEPLYDYAERLGLVEALPRPGWGTMGHPIVLRDFEDDDRDEFFVLGDNSPESLDSRGWAAAGPTLRLLDERGEPQYRLGTVPRYNLLGKALFVYWPAGYRLPVLDLPLIPNVGRMRLIR
ncbi:MAG: signal peptidase I [Planctomycetota bacterium]